MTIWRKHPFFPRTMKQRAVSQPPRPPGSSELASASTQLLNHQPRTHLGLQDPFHARHVAGNQVVSSQALRARCVHVARRRLAFSHHLHAILHSGPNVSDGDSIRRTSLLHLTSFHLASFLAFSSQARSRHSPYIPLSITHLQTCFPHYC